MLLLVRLARLLAFAGIVVLAASMIAKPLGAAKGQKSDYECLYGKCEGYQHIQGGYTCVYTSTNAGWTCTVAPNKSCAFNDKLYGSITCVGVIQGSNPEEPCSLVYDCCSNAPPP